MSYTAADERQFMVGLLNEGKVEFALKYARLVLRNERRWDASVVVGKVMEAARATEAVALARLNGEGTAFLGDGGVGGPMSHAALFSAVDLEESPASDIDHLEPAEPVELL